MWCLCRKSDSLCICYLLFGVFISSLRSYFFTGIPGKTTSYMLVMSSRNVCAWLMKYFVESTLSKHILQFPNSFNSRLPFLPSSYFRSLEILEKKSFLWYLHFSNFIASRLKVKVKSVEIFMRYHTITHLISLSFPGLNKIVDCFNKIIDSSCKHFQGCWKEII